MLDKDTLSNLLDRFQSSDDRAFIDEHPHQYQRICDAIANTDPKRFVTACKRRGTNETTARLVSLAVLNRTDGTFMAILTGQFEQFFEHLMESTEGSACCADKSRFVTRRCLDAVITSTSHDLTDAYDLKTAPQMEAYRDEQPYWCPTTVSTTDQAINLWRYWHAVDIPRFLAELTIS